MGQTQQELVEQTALVTGASRGIGRVIAVALAQAGVRVALVARSAEKLQETARLIHQQEGTALVLPGDVTRRETVDDILRQIETAWGTVNILINNAGSHRALGPLWEVDPDLWWEDIETNLRSTFICARAVLPGMLRQQHGYIINISSNAGNEPRPYSTAYSSAKAAVTRLTEGITHSTEGQHIYTFALHPGSVRTEMADYLVNSQIGQRWVPEFRGIYERTEVPAERVANLLLRLVRGEANMLNGCLLSVYDDLDMLIAEAERVKQEQLYRLRLTRL